MSNKPTSWDDLPTLELSDEDEWETNADKRRHQRITERDLKKLLQFPATIPIILLSRKYGMIEGNLLDLSKSGLRTKMKQSVQKNEPIEMAIFLKNRKLRCKGVIRWVQKHSDLSYEIGVEFSEISPTDSAYIGSIITTNIFERKIQT